MLQKGVEGGHWEYVPELGVYPEGVVAGLVLFGFTTGVVMPWLTLVPAPPLGLTGGILTHPLESVS